MQPVEMISFLSSISILRGAEWEKFDWNSGKPKSVCDVATVSSLVSWAPRNIENTLRAFSDNVITIGLFRLLRIWHRRSISFSIKRLQIEYLRELFSQEAHPTWCRLCCNPHAKRHKLLCSIPAQMVFALRKWRSDVHTLSPFKRFK